MSRSSSWPGQTGEPGDADALRTELTARAEALRAKLRDIDLDRLGTRRLLRAFPRMQSARYAETLAATRQALVHLRRLARNARAAAQEAADRCGGKSMLFKGGNSPARRCLTVLFPPLDSPSTKFDGKSRTLPHTICRQISLYVSAPVGSCPPAQTFYNF